MRQALPCCTGPEISHQLSRHWYAHGGLAGNVMPLNATLTMVLSLQAVGAPIGAALLTNLRPCYVEFVMACVLLLVIILHCKVWQHIQTWCHSRTPK